MLDKDQRVIVVMVMCAITWHAMQFTAEVEQIQIKKALSLFPHTVVEHTFYSSFQNGVLGKKSNVDSKTN